MQDMINRLRHTVFSSDRQIFQESATALEKLTAEVAALRAELAAVTAWKEEGEKIFGGANGVLFSLGAWWADRPWRAAPGASPQPSQARELSEDEWLNLAERHACADWGSDKPDGFLFAVKALVADYIAAINAKGDVS